MAPLKQLLYLGASIQEYLSKNYPPFPLCALGGAQCLTLAVQLILLGHGLLSRNTGLHFFFFFVMGHAQVVSYGWAFSNNHNFRCLGRGFRTGDRAQRANLQPLRPSFQSLVQLLQQSQLWTDAFLHWPSPVWEACLDCGFCHSNVIALSCYSLGYFFLTKQGSCETSSGFLKKTWYIHLQVTNLKPPNGKYNC